MKKTLALLLALLMMLSVALVSCGSDEEENTGDFGDAFDFSGGDSTKDTSKDNDTEGEDNTASAGYVATNDTVYACYKAILRASDKSSAAEVATVEFETALKRVAKGRKWSQINYNGTTAYIANDLITESKSAVTFKDVPENTKRTVNKLGQMKNANLRAYPLALTNPLVVELDAFNMSSIIGQIPKGTEVTVLKISEDNAWAYIECQGMKAKGDGEYETTATLIKGYCSTSVFDTGFGTTSSNVSGGALG